MISPGPLHPLPPRPLLDIAQEDACPALDIQCLHAGRQIMWTTGINWNLWLHDGGMTSETSEWLKCDLPQCLHVDPASALQVIAVGLVTGMAISNSTAHAWCIQGTAVGDWTGSTPGGSTRQFLLGSVGAGIVPCFSNLWLYNAIKMYSIIEISLTHHSICSLNSGETIMTPFESFEPIGQPRSCIRPGTFGVSCGHWSSYHGSLGGPWWCVWNWFSMQICNYVEQPWEKKNVSFATSLRWVRFSIFHGGCGVANKTSPKGYIFCLSIYIFIYLFMILLMYLFILFI